MGDALSINNYGNLLRGVFKYKALDCRPREFKEPQAPSCLLLCAESSVKVGKSSKEMEKEG